MPDRRSSRRPPSGSGLARLGTACGRHPLIVLAAWMVVLVIAAAGSRAAGGSYSDSITLDTQGYAGLHTLKVNDPALSGFTGRVVIHAVTGTVAAQRFAMHRSVAALGRLPHVLSTTDPLSATDPTVSADGRTAYSVLHFDVVPKTLGSSYLVRMDTAVAPLRHAGLEVVYGGDLDLLTQPQLSDGGPEVTGLLIAIAVLLVGFGSLLGALIPLLTALISVAIGLGLLGVVSAVLTFATASPTLAVMIGLGVAIDYALFLTTRFRQLLASGTDPATAVGLTVATSGHAVVVAAMTVSVAILGLYTSGLTFIGQLGLACVLSVLTAGAAAVTLVPAGLGLIGRRIDVLSVRPPVAESSSDSDGWHRYATLVGRRPWRFLVGGVTILGVLAIPLLSMHLGHVDDGADPGNYSDKRAYDLVAAAYGPGANGPFTVVVDLRGTTGGTVAALGSHIRYALSHAPNVASVGALVPTRNGRILVGSVVPRSGPQAPATTDLFHRLVHTTLPAAIKGNQVAAYVTGSAALQVEFADSVTRKLPLIIAVVVATAFLLLLATFGGLLLAIKAAVLNLLSIAAAYGVVVAVFQWGWGRGLLGVSENVPIESYVPMIMFAIVFGLSLDYEVFLLSRVKEVWDVTGDHPLSVARGLAATARVISCAALIMASVLAAFVASNSVVIKMIALGLSFSILIDATVVRLLLVPAVMYILGGASSWWLPGWMDRMLPRLDTFGPRSDLGGEKGAVGSPPERRHSVAAGVVGRSESFAPQEHP